MISIALACIVVVAIATAVIVRWGKRSASKVVQHNRRLSDRLAESTARQRKLELDAAAAAERDRIFADLHDDIGGKLLTLVHSADGTPAAALAREVLQDLRAVISNSHHVEGTLLEVLAQIRDEAEARAATGGAELRWEQASDLPDSNVNEADALHMFRIVREAVSNALRHAQPKQIRIRCRRGGQTLVLDITDDGDFTGRAIAGTGRGTRSMQSRALALDGNVAWGPGTGGGTKVILKLPLDRLSDGLLLMEPPADQEPKP